ncbi:MAG: DUF2155 domain-containing protein [Parasphingorhabdus sp.]|nr:DUF2155 domain-containing protein [Parasphingorhabdus sp.]
MMTARQYYALIAPLVLLAACGQSEQKADPNAGKPAERAKVAATNEELVKPVAEQIGTPMEQRVATLGFLNKRNGLTRDLELKPGQSIRIGRAIVHLRACEKTAPWELTPEQGAFVQLDVNEKPPNRPGNDQWKRVFSGWLFRESPSLNIVEHPIYDVWVKSCTMSFPGEEGGADSSDDAAASPRPERARASSPSSAPNSAEDETDAPDADPGEEDTAA